MRIKTTTVIPAARREVEIHTSGNATLRCEAVPKSSVIPAIKPIAAQTPKMQAPQQYEASAVGILLNLRAPLSAICSEIDMGCVPHILKPNGRT